MNILNRVKALYEKTDEVEQVERFIKEKSYAGTSLVNATYVARLDLADRYFAITN